jgi:hypothetical protein
MISHVSKHELQEVHAKFGVPAAYQEDGFVDVTDWVGG